MHYGRGWGRRDRREEERIGRASFGHIDRLMIAWNKGQTVTWSRGRVMDRFRRGGAPRRRPARFTAFNPGGTGRSDWLRSRPTGRRHASISGKRNDQVYLPLVLFGFAPLIPRARSPARPLARSLSPAAVHPKNGHSAVKFDRENDFANLFSSVRFCENFFLLLKI